MHDERHGIDQVMKGLLDYTKDFNSHLKDHEQPLKNLEQKGWDLDFRMLILALE